MVFKSVRVTNGEYRFLVNQDLYVIKKELLDYQVYWTADNTVINRKAFRADKKRDLIHQILQHHAKQS